MGQTVFTSTLSNIWVGKTNQELDGAVLEMATDIDKRAKMFAPVDSSALVNSSRIAREATASYSVTFGSSAVPYARRRHYENRRNPQTLKYLERAGDSVTRGDITKYIRS